MITWNSGARLLAVAVILSAPAVAGAQAINGAATGLTNPTTTITFSEHSLNSNDIVGTQWAAEGVTFSPYLQYEPLANIFFPTPYLADFGGANLTDPFEMVFSQVLDGAAFNMWTNSAPVIFTALLNGNQVATFTGAPAGDITLWWGFQNVDFNEIKVDMTGGFGAAEIDNLEMTPAPATATPEPATIALVATGLVGIGGLGLARRQKA